MNQGKVIRWEELPKDSPIARIERQRIIGKQAMLSKVVLHTGCFVAAHAHENEQFAVVLSGRVRFGLGDEGSADYKEVTLVGGEVLYLPANVKHSARALEETHILDVFSPPSEATGIDTQKQ